MSIPKGQRELGRVEVRRCYLPPQVFSSPSSIVCGRKTLVYSREPDRVTCPKCRHLMGWSQAPINEVVQ